MGPEPSSVTRAPRILVSGLEVILYPRPYLSLAAEWIHYTLFGIESVRYYGPHIFQLKRCFL